MRYKHIFKPFKTHESEQINARYPSEGHNECCYFTTYFFENPAKISNFLYFELLSRWIFYFKKVYPHSKFEMITIGNPKPEPIKLTTAKVNRIMLKVLRSSFLDARLSARIKLINMQKLNAIKANRAIMFNL